MSEDEGDKYDRYNESLRDYGKDLDSKIKSKIKKWEVHIKEDNTFNHIPKVMKVEILETLDIKEVPHVLATLQCNQHHSRLTCSKIEDKGAIQAIKHCLGEQVNLGKNAKATELMGLLSPYQLETLVFLILKNADLFVSAWRGGGLKNIDIIAKNLTRETITIPPIEGEPIEFPFEVSKTFQVKRKVSKKDLEDIRKRDDINYIVAIDREDDKKEKTLTAKWLCEQIKEKKQEDTKKWFLDSLKWVLDSCKCKEKIQEIIENRGRQTQNEK